MSKSRKKSSRVIRKKLMSKCLKKRSQIIRNKSSKIIRKKSLEPITEQCLEDPEYLIVSNCPKFHIPRKYGHYLHDSAEAVDGSIGVIRMFHSPDGSSSIAIKQKLKVSGFFVSHANHDVLQREIILLRQLKHDNIVQFVEVYTALHELELGIMPVMTSYLVTQYCGDTLSKVIHNGGYEMENVQRWIRELLSALTYLYSINIIPERLNPKKMCIDKTRKLTLIGISRRRDIEEAVNFENVISKKVYNDSYSALETLFRWDSQGDEKVNIWSVGVILCEMLNGSRLFNTRNSVAKQIIDCCGPVDDTVLAKIEDSLYREHISRWSIGAKRKNFMKILRSEAKGKRLIAELDSDTENVVRDFIERTLQLNPTSRMSVMNATLHPFLNQNSRPAVQNDDELATRRHHIWDMCQLPEGTPLPWRDFSSKFENVYDHVRVIGKGGFGCVFYAEKSISGRIIWKRAVKRIALMGRAEEVREAVKEVEAMMSLEVHPGIVRFFDAWTEKPPPGWQPSSDERMFTAHTGREYTGVMPDYKDNCTYLYIEMELCQSSLSDWLSVNETRDPTTMKQWFKQIVSAVGFIHENKYIHRDLKPCNILFSRDNQLKICDLGIVTERALNNAPNEEEEAVERTFARGTRMYMAPEQMGWSDYSSKVDIFALGLIFTEMLVSMGTDEAAVIFDKYRNGQPNEVLDHLPESKKFVAWLTNVDDTERPDCKTILKHSILSSI